MGTALGVIIPEGAVEVFGNAIAHRFNSTIPLDELQLPSSFEFDQRQIGLPVVLGFLLMLLLEQLKPHRLNWLLHPLTLGLSLHSVFDGLLVSASLASSSPHLQRVVFFSMLLHQLPTAATLSTLLMSKGLGKPQVQIQLAVFASIAPLSALAGLAFLSKVEEYEGFLLLLSAGTFLYVSVVHVLPLVVEGGHGTGCISSDYEAIGNEREAGSAQPQISVETPKAASPKWRLWLDLSLFGLGACLPLLLSHSH
jgi:zinc transporter ZupT